MKSPSFVFIVNPISGIKKKERIVSLIKTSLETYDIQIQFTEKAGHATELAEAAKNNKAAAVIAIGGDGTVNEVAKGLLFSDTALGIIPCGSGNGFARHLGIPMKVKAAIELLNRFKVITIDTASINNEVFISTAGIGFDAQIGWDFANFDKRGLSSYIQLTAKAFLHYHPKTYELCIDGEDLQTEAFLINFANGGQYGNNAWIAPSASLTDGELNVCILEKFPAHIAPEILLRIFSKQIEHSKYYRLIKAKEIKIKSPLPYHLDGEARKSETDLIVKCVPKSLKVIC